MQSKTHGNPFQFQIANDNKYKSGVKETLVQVGHLQSAALSDEPTKKTHLKTFPIELSLCKFLTIFKNSLIYVFQSFPS